MIKLVKENDFYYLLQDDKIVADLDGHPLKSITGKLSKQNCDDIFGVVDLMKLAEENSHKYYDVKTTDWHCNYNGFFSGFQKAMELNKDKVFTLEDMRKAFNKGHAVGVYLMDYKNEEVWNEFIKPIQQPTEIEVEIEMECNIGCVNFVFNGENSRCCGDKTPKLDSEGCLILKRAK